MANWEEDQVPRNRGQNRERISPDALWRTRRACGRCRRSKRHSDIRIVRQIDEGREGFTYWNDVKDAHGGGWELREER
jgi:hypothetical protein